jgi:hypothetical protein
MAASSGVADVAEHQPVTRAPLRGFRAGVCLGQQVVQHDGLVAPGGEHVGDMGTDEPGAAGDQHSHRYDISLLGSMA